VTAPRGLRDGSDSRGMNIPLSPLLLGSLIAGCVGTILLVAFLVVQFQADPDPGGPRGQGEPPEGPPPLPPFPHLAFIVAMAFFALAWLAVLAAASRDQLMRRIDDMEARMVTLTTQYGEDRRTEGYVDGVHEATRPISPPAGLRSVPRPPQ